MPDFELFSLFYIQPLKYPHSKIEKAEAIQEVNLSKSSTWKLKVRMPGFDSHCSPMYKLLPHHTFPQFLEKEKQKQTKMRRPRLCNWSFFWIPVLWCCLSPLSQRWSGRLLPNHQLFLLQGSTTPLCVPKQMMHGYKITTTSGPPGCQQQKK